jgi:predicted aspartyl protease
MIAGAVTGDREIVIQVDALAADRSFVSIQAVVDTGFNGFLTLPLDVLNALGATAAGTRRAE